MSDEGEIHAEWTTSELEKMGLHETYVGGLEEAGTRTPGGEPGAEEEQQEVGADMRPGAQQAASGRGRGGGRPSRPRRKTPTRDKRCAPATTRRERVSLRG